MTEEQLNQFKKLMITKLGTSDDASAQLVSDIVDSASGGGAAEKHYVIPQNTSITTDEEYSAYFDPTVDGVFFAPTLKIKYDGEEYTAEAQVGLPGLIQWVIDELTGIFLSYHFEGGEINVTQGVYDEEHDAGTTHTIEAWYEGDEMHHILIPCIDRVNSGGEWETTETLAGYVPDENGYSFDIKYINRSNYQSYQNGIWSYPTFGENPQITTISSFTGIVGGTHTFDDDKNYITYINDAVVAVPYIAY